MQIWRKKGIDDIFFYHNHVEIAWNIGATLVPLYIKYNKIHPYLERLWRKIATLQQQLKPMPMMIHLQRIDVEEKNELRKKIQELETEKKEDQIYIENVENEYADYFGAAEKEIGYFRKKDREQKFRIKELESQIQQMNLDKDEQLKAIRRLKSDLRYIKEKNVSLEQENFLIKEQNNQMKNCQNCQHYKDTIGWHNCTKWELLTEQDKDLCIDSNLCSTWQHKEDG